MPMQKRVINFLLNIIFFQSCFFSSQNIFAYLKNLLKFKDSPSTSPELGSSHTKKEDNLNVKEVSTEISDPKDFKKKFNKLKKKYLKYMKKHSLETDCNEETLNEPLDKAAELLNELQATFDTDTEPNEGTNV